MRWINRYFYFSGSILLLLAWAGYSRVRNIRYLKREYGQEKDQDESKGLLNQWAGQAPKSSDRPEYPDNLT